MIKNFLFSFIRTILIPFIIIYFWFIRWIKHNKFKYNLNWAYLGKPSLISYPFIYLDKIILKTLEIFDYEFGNYALDKYKVFSKEHYSEKGISYGHLRNLTNEEKKSFYEKGKSRLEYFYRKNNFLINLKNGDSFLDVACGYGPDIKFLSNNFDKSIIEGFDINDEAVKVIKLFNKNSNVSVQAKSFEDLDFLRGIESNKYDWILISHALSTVFEKNYEKTLTLRRKIIDEFTRISKKGLLILDHRPENNFKVKIEQNTRCVISFDTTKLFESINNGELYMMKSDDSFAYFWKKTIKN